VDYPTLNYSFSKIVNIYWNLFIINQLSHEGSEEDAKALTSVQAAEADVISIYILMLGLG
jgi:hypothetical protein